MEELINDDDLKDLFAELNKEINSRMDKEDNVVGEEELTASQQRYENIIKKHKSGK